MTVDWTDIERRLGLEDARGFARREILPLIADVPVARAKKDGKRENRLDLPMGLGFFSFVAAFMTLDVVLPETFLTVALRFVLFPLLFFAMLGLWLYLFRGRLVGALMDGKARFIARSRALSALAAQLSLSYAPAPGGAPEALKMLSRFRWSPAILREAAAVLDAHGGMDEAVRIARASGAMADSAMVLGTDDQKADYHARRAAGAQVEDGFEGSRDGVPFSAFEWVEKVEDAPNVYHLVMVMRAPRRFYGVTQLRSRRTAWPAADPALSFSPVGVVAPAFEDRFRMRATDQVEARAIFDPVVLERVATLARGETVRAVAFDAHLVIDVAGEDRFAMVDLITGEWSEETIAGAMANIADMLELVDALAHAFKLRAAA